jgi:uncharacterized membrane protein
MNTETKNQEIVEAVGTEEVARELANMLVEPTGSFQIQNTGIITARPAGEREDPSAIALRKRRAWY